jgi:two-component system sensor histidine kinase KdpD
MGISSPPTETGTDAMDTGFFDLERERVHRQILSSVSHDLKTPLASIIGSLEIYDRMQDKIPPEKKRMLIGVALEEAYRLDNFITNILDMAKLENKMVKIRQDAADLGVTLQNCLTKLGYRLKDSAVNLKPLSGSIAMMTDSALVGRIVYLLVDNAVKYGSRSPVIDIEYGQEGSRGFIHIHDNGPGIPEERQDIIFSKYTRFAMEDQQNAGTGLGLSICREMTNLIGGELKVANHTSGGAIFSLAFPLTWPTALADVAHKVEG